MNTKDHIDYLLSGYEEGFASHSEIREYLLEYHNSEVAKAVVEALEGLFNQAAITPGGFMKTKGWDSHVFICLAQNKLAELLDMPLPYPDLAKYKQVTEEQE